jgi:hypothetical protein
VADVADVADVARWLHHLGRVVHRRLPALCAVAVALRSPEDRYRDGIAALSIDGCAGLDEEVAERVVVVDGRPLFVYWSSFIFYTSCIRTCNGVMPCSSL